MERVVLKENEKGSKKKGSKKNKNLNADDSELVCKVQSDTTKVTKEMFNNPLCSDVKIFIDDKVIRGHKFVLLRNPSFFKMISSNPDLKEIYFFDHEDVLKFSSKACETFLRYLYGNTEIKKEFINLDLMLVAYNYSDEILKDFCQNHLIRNVNVRNAVRTLLVSLETQSEELKIKACKFIARNFNEMKFKRDLDLILENEDALSAILNVFDDCNIILLKSKVEDENLKDSLNQLRSSDLLVTVGNFYFLGHKKILSERNMIFKVLIDCTSVDSFSTSVSIPNVDLESFKIFLHYIYTGEVNSYYDVTENLLKVAHNYIDNKLKDICEGKIIEKLDCDTAIQLLFFAMEFKCEHLQKCALNYIVDKYDKISSQDDYQKLLKNPDATNVFIRTLHERQKSDTEKTLMVDLS